MKRKKEKGHWVKMVENFSSGAEAKVRAGTLRTHKNVVHVKVDKEGDRYTVRYSVSKPYLEQLEAAGLKL